MNNIYSYSDFLNEGLFGSEYKPIINKIYNYIKDTDISTINYKETDKKDTYTFTMRKARKEDPYGEENWEGEEIGIKLEVWYSGGNLKLALYINNDIVDATKREVKKIYNLLEFKRKNKEKLDRKKRIETAFDKF